MLNTSPKNNVRPAVKCAICMLRLPNSGVETNVFSTRGVNEIKQKGGGNFTDDFSGPHTPWKKIKNFVVKQTQNFE